MSFNPDTFDLMIKLALGMVAILMLIFLLAVITPKLSKLVDKLLGKNKIDRGDNTVTLPDGQKYTVRDIYDGEPPEDAPAEKENEEKE